MQKLLQAISLVCCSFSCVSMGSDDTFLKVSHDSYLQYHCEPLANNKNVKIGRMTSTYIKTFGGVEPISVREMQTINYIAGGVVLYKDYENSCCIDVYESIHNPNKCRIIGRNGKTIHLGSHCFSVYEVSIKEASFVYNEPRLIFLDTSGLYIVPAKKNPIDTVIGIYKQEKTFKFQNPIIEISAIYGDRTINGHHIDSTAFLDESAPSESPCSEDSVPMIDKIFVLNCSIKTPMVLAGRFGSVTKLYPAMQQVEQIASVQVCPPPSEKSVIKRIAEVLGLDLITDLLIVRNGKVCLVDVTEAAIKGEIPGVVWSLDDASWFVSCTTALQRFIPLIDQGIQWSDYTQACLNIDLFIKTGMMKEYVFDTSAAAVTHRQHLASRAWDNI